MNIHQLPTFDDTLADSVKLAEIRRVVTQAVGFAEGQLGKVKEPMKGTDHGTHYAMCAGLLEATVEVLIAYLGQIAGTCKPDPVPGLDDLEDWYDAAARLTRMGPMTRRDIISQNVTGGLAVTTKHTFGVGEYTMRNGQKATVYEVVSDGRLIGARDFEGGRFGCEWNASGRVVWGEEHHIDLMPPREKLFRYAAIYSNGVVNVWCNSANIVKHDNQLVAIVPIEIEYTEGEGL